MDKKCCKTCGDYIHCHTKGCTCKSWYKDVDKRQLDMFDEYFKTVMSWPCKSCKWKGYFCTCGDLMEYRETKKIYCGGG